VRREWRFGLAAAVALAAGATLADPYARLAAPYYAAIDRLIARAHPWTIEQVTVSPDPGGQGAVLRLVGEVRRERSDPKPAAIVVSRVQVGEAIETPIVFWTLLLTWPAASARQRWLRLATGFAVFLGLEAITTAAQLVHSMAVATAVLAQQDPALTLWERWARFLEAGGDFALAVVGALATLAISNAIVLSWVRRAQRRATNPASSPATTCSPAT
jgi:hypothetical protein